MKAYITKYALTKGITEMEGKISDHVPAMFCPISKGYIQPVHKPYWHSNKEEAIQQANKMRDAKTSSLKKQIEKLEKLNFDR